MPDTQAVITLYPLYFPDVLPFRSLTFSSDTDCVKIGRASKRESKNLIPAHHNGLFDSRVMSRNHARLRVSFEKRDVYIRDGGSMHGTWVNGGRIPVEKDVVISSGDVVTFGTEVTRGTDTFPPLQVRCECQWFDSEDKAQTPTTVNEQERQTTNTFCVPDDEDDEDDDDDDDLIALSDPGSDSDDQHAAENPTPMTSPLKEERPLSVIEGDDILSKPSASNRQRLVNGSQQLPIDLDSEQIEQPLVTPRITPPLVENDSANANVDIENQLDYIDQDSDNEPIACEEDSAVESDDWEGDEDQACLEDESMSHSSFEIDAEQSNPATESVASSSVPPLEAEVAAGLDGMSASLNPLVTSFLSQTNNMSLNRPESGLDEIPTKPTPLESNWTSTVAGAVLNPPLQPSGKIFDHPLTAFRYNKEEWPSQLTSSSAYDSPEYNAWRPASLEDNHISRVPYTDGPFVNSQLRPVNAGISGSNETYSNYVAPMKLNSVSPQIQFSDQNFGKIQNGAYAGQSGAPSMSSLDNSRATRESNTRLSIADIVDTSSYVAPKTTRPSLKRKAMEMEMEVVEGDFAKPGSSSQNRPISGPEEESYLQDAQPQASLGCFNSSYSQLSELRTATEPQDAVDARILAPESGRPSKKAKTSGSGSFKSHAATAVISAMIGGLGTIALLASLPPDYFM